MAEMPPMKMLFALMALAVLLFGCAQSGVPQEKYDELSANCNIAKEDSASALSIEIAKTSAANARFSSCNEEKKSLEALLDVRKNENAALRAEEAVLDSARAKTGIAGQYNATMAYYLEAYGPDKVPNNARIKKIDTQVNSLNDAALKSYWVDVKNCQGISGCDDAKEKFTSYIDGRITAFNLEAAAIVGKGQ